MLIGPGPVFSLLDALAALVEDGGPHVGARLFHATRLIAALAIATLVPLVIDRRLRR